DAGAQPLRKGVRLPKRFDLPQQGGADGFFLFQKIKHVLILPVPKRERAGKTRRRIFPALRRSPAASIAQLPKNEKDFSVPQKRHALGGTHFCAQPRDRNSFPLILLRLANFRGARALAKIGALRQRWLAVSSTGRASPPLPLGTKFAAEPCTRRKAARTLSAANFPVCVPSIRTCRLDGTFR